MVLYMPALRQKKSRQRTAVKCGSDSSMPAVRSLGLPTPPPPCMLVVVLLLALPLMRSLQLPGSSSGRAVSAVWKGKSRTSVARHISNRVYVQHHNLHCQVKRVRGK